MVRYVCSVVLKTIRFKIHIFPCHANRWVKISCVKATRYTYIYVCRLFNLHATGIVCMNKKSWVFGSESMYVHTYVWRMYFHIINMLDVCTVYYACAKLWQDMVQLLMLVCMYVCISIDSNAWCSKGMHGNVKSYPFLFKQIWFINERLHWE